MYFIRWTGSRLRDPKPPKSPLDMSPRGLHLDLGALRAPCTTIRSRTDRRVVRAPPKIILSTRFVVSESLAMHHGFTTFIVPSPSDPNRLVSREKTFVAKSSEKAQGEGDAEHPSSHREESEAHVRTRLSPKHTTPSLRSQSPAKTIYQPFRCQHSLQCHLAKLRGINHHTSPLSVSSISTNHGQLKDTLLLPLSLH